MTTMKITFNNDELTEIIKTHLCSILSISIDNAVVEVSDSGVEVSFVKTNIPKKRNVKKETTELPLPSALKAPEVERITDAKLADGTDDVEAQSATVLTEDQFTYLVTNCVFNNKPMSQSEGYGINTFIHTQPTRAMELLFDGNPPEEGSCIEATRLDTPLSLEERKYMFYFKLKLLQEVLNDKTGKYTDCHVCQPVFSTYEDPTYGKAISDRQLNITGPNGIVETYIKFPKKMKVESVEDKEGKEKTRKLMESFKTL